MKSRYLPFVLSIVVFTGTFLLSRILYGDTDSSLINTILGMSSFIFGVFFAYFLNVSNSKFTKINEALRRDDKSLLGIYYSSKILDKNEREEITRLIDEYLVSQIDHYLVDYPQTSREFNKLYQYCMNITASGFKEEEAYERIMDLLNESLENRKMVESQLWCKMTLQEWLSLIVFALTIVVCMYILSNGGLFASFLISIICVGITMIMYLLYDIDSLQWKSDALIWIPLSKLFKDMNMLPYLPLPVFARFRSKFMKESVRLAKFPNEYPDFSGKEVREYEVK